MPKLRVGVLGLGMMGNTHLDAYARREDVEVVAVADANPARLDGSEFAAGNVEGQAEGGDNLSGTNRYAEAAELIEQEDLDIIDICLPTPLHLDYAKQAIAKGRHVLLEKPLCRTTAQAEELLAAAEASDRIIMPAMCIRFWPGWDTLIQAVKEQTYGPLHALSVQRLASHPGGGFYSDAEACGGALLDLHIHDTDFVYAALGMPKAVRSVGYARVTGGPDHVSTQFIYDNGPAVVVAEGGWAFHEGYPFTMRYEANFANASLRYDMAAEHPLAVMQNGEVSHPELSPKMGYDIEIDYFLDCVNAGTAPTRVTLADSLASLRINEAERASLASGETVALG
jgi:predicted dehydrogenase